MRVVLDLDDNIAIDFPRLGSIEGKLVEVNFERDIVEVGSDGPWTEYRPMKRRKVILVVDE